jgi:5-oxoprolinase (ATP-hydrolysing)
LDIFKPAVLYKQVVEVDERVKLLSKFEDVDSSSIMTIEAYKNSLNKEMDEIIENMDQISEDPPEDVNINGPVLKLAESTYLRILQKPNLKKLAKNLLSIKNKGINSLGICLMHSYIFDLHEQIVFRLAELLGFSNISCSSKIFPKVNFVRRGNATLLDAYLNPIISEYLERFLSGFTDSSISKSINPFRPQNDEI